MDRLSLLIVINSYAGLVGAYPHVLGVIAKLHKETPREEQSAVRRMLNGDVLRAHWDDIDRKRDARRELLNQGTDHLKMMEAYASNGVQEYQDYLVACRSCRRTGDPMPAPHTPGCWSWKGKHERRMSAR